MTTTWGSVVRATAKKHGWRSVRGDWYVIRDDLQRLTVPPTA